MMPCGAAESSVHVGLARLLERHHINEYAASMQIFAVNA
jgi:hypothetical protein